MVELPKITLSPLRSADGSASYSAGGFTIIASANGPIEPQRRDEQPEIAFVEVNVRPASGGGSPRDRLLESLLHNTLTSIIDLHAYPRMMVQLTAQVVRTPESEFGVAPPGQANTGLTLLPHLLNACVLALLAGNVSMKGVAAACAVIRDPTTGKLTLDGSGKASDAVHDVFAFAFTGDGQCLLMQSESPGCGFADFGEAYAIAEARCCGDEGLLEWMRESLTKDIQRAQWWRRGEA